MSVFIQGIPDTECIKRTWGSHPRRWQNQRVKRNIRRKIARHSRNLNRRTGHGR